MRMTHLYLLACLVAPTVAFAQETGGLNAHGFVLTAQDGDIRDGWVLQRPGAMNAQEWFVGAAFEYANRPLVLVTEVSNQDDEVNVALNHIAALNVSGGYVLHDRVRLALAAPLYLTSTGLDGGQGAALGDVRLDLMLSLLSPNDNDVGFAIVPWLDLPTGPTQKFLGQSKTGGGLMAAATYELEQATFTGDLGVQLNPKVSIENLNGADALIAGVGGNYLLDDVSSLGLETHFTVPFAKNDRAGTGAPAEALFSYRRRTASGGYFTGGLALPLSPGAGAASYRLILGGGFGKLGPSAPRDRDLDGVTDDVDACPDEPETMNGYVDEDGCPDELAKLIVTVRYEGAMVEDARLIIDGPDGQEKADTGAEPWSKDVRPESMWRIQAKKGDCLLGDVKQLVDKGQHNAIVDLEFQASASVQVYVHDGDDRNIPGARLMWDSKTPECVPTPPPLDIHGKANQDIGPGNHRLLVGAPGFRVVEVPVLVEPGDQVPIEVILKKTKLRVEAKRIVILEKVRFESAKAVIKKSSFDLLNEVAEVLRRNTQAGRIEIQGHTDSNGGDRYNLELSQDRAEAVRKFLIQAGVDRQRLIAVGYGEGSPVGNNNTERGRATNRRVEFHLIDQSSDSIEEQAPE